ncbi:MAG: hypothetical protein JSW41_00370 [Candidatus Aenigmatarchaeota archaeon]|nr:MAG: hypothetical protein JSW41_00370 [Candidatus Aenigmarchaeota archaeon]
MKKIFLIGFALFLALINSANALVEISPASEDLSIYSDTEYVFDVDISGVDNVYGFQFDILYDPGVFEITDPADVTKGTFLNRNGQDQDTCTNADVLVPGIIDNYACSRMGSGSVSGNGTLATVRLTIKQSAVTPNTSSIQLSNVKTSDINSQPLDNTSQNGTANVYECLYGETRTCLGGTRTCTTGNIWGSCQTTSNGGGPPPPPGGVPPPPSNGENGDGETPQGDIDEDGCVDIDDLLLVAANFGLTSGFDPEADLDGNGKIDIFDLVIVALDFGKGPDC